MKAAGPSGTVAAYGYPDGATTLATEAKIHLTLNGGTRMTDVITKAELARELNLSRARISQLSKMGLPVRPDGKLTRAEAMAWIKGNVCSWLGGWQLRKARGCANTAPMAATVASLPELFELPDLEIPDWEGEIREAAVIDFMNEVRLTGNIESFARVALRFGCTMRQAFAVARFLDMFMAFCFVPQEPNRAYIRVHEEPDWNRLAVEAGTTADVEGWQDWMNQRLEDGEQGKAEA